MFAFLSGLVRDISVTDPTTAVVDVHGVGYEVLCSPRLSEQLAVGSAFAAPIHTHVSEDAIVLYGFASAQEKQLYRALLSVSKVGPKTALALLAIPPELFARALAEGDARHLPRVPGVGGKTAERIVLELRGRQLSLPAATAASGSALPADVAAALQALGFVPSEIDKAFADSGAWQHIAGDDEALIRYFLQHRG